MAVVTFQRPGDALAAQAKYDGKIVDGRESESLCVCEKPPHPHNPLLWAGSFFFWFFLLFLFFSIH